MVIGAVCGKAVLIIMIVLNQDLRLRDTFFTSGVVPLGECTNYEQLDPLGLSRLRGQVTWCNRVGTDLQDGLRFENSSPKWRFV